MRCRFWVTEATDCFLMITSLYYSISEKRMAQVNRLGQVTKVYNFGDYSLHHDYVFDENGNMLILGNGYHTGQCGDIVLKLDVNSGEVDRGTGSGRPVW